METQDVASLRFIVDLAILRDPAWRIDVETQHFASAMRRIADTATPRGASL